MSPLIFIRHAETDMAGTFCGHSDPPLNRVGQEQVRNLTAQLKDNGIDMIYSSDLQRAVETADELSRAFILPVSTTPSLREIDFGAWEGLTWIEVTRRDPIFSARWAEAFPAYPAPGGEQYTAFSRRVHAEIDRLLRLSQGRRIGVVTHAGVMRIVLQDLLGLSAQDAWERTRSYVCWFEYSGRHTEWASNEQ